MSPSRTDDPARCSSWSRLQSLDPIGTAGSYQGFLLIEMPLPWPSDIGVIAEIATLADILHGRNVRIQALVPESTDRKVVLYEKSDPSAFRGFVRRWLPVGSDLSTTVAALLEGDGERNRDDRAVGDLLLCTHGRRDRCCGSLGTALALELARDSDGAATFGGTSVQLWRTSHTGGHRFAPTMILLPEGTLWAYADAELIGRLLRRDGNVNDVVDRYRGCAGLTSPAVQALEREALRAVGWDLFECARRGAELGDDRYSLEVSLPNGAVETWTGQVGVGRTLGLPECGQASPTTSKSVTELVVRDVEHTSTTRVSESAQ